jgi:hypothetical protein
MSLALLDRAQQRLPDANEWLDSRGMGRVGRRGASLRSSPRLSAQGNCTLDELVTARWQRLASGESARCPVCDGQMEPCEAHAAAAYGRCLDCGATLA